MTYGINKVVVQTILSEQSNAPDTSTLVSAKDPPSTNGLLAHVNVQFCESVS